MKNSMKLFVALLCGMAISCKKETALQKAQNQFLNVEAAYCTNDVRGAEKALIDHLPTLSREESNQVRGIDYDMARAIVHERLFLIYRKTHETNKMKLEFEESMQHLRRFDEKNGLPP